MAVVAHLEVIAPVPGAEPGEGVWLPVRNHLGVDAFGINAFVAAFTIGAPARGVTTPPAFRALG